MYKEINKCRVCGSSNLNVIFDLGIQSLTGIFPKNKTDEVISGPVILVQCSGENSCNLPQLKYSYDVEKMYGENYGYRSGLNSSMVDHLQDKVAKILQLDILEKGDLVIDIGSNDATSLKSYPTGLYKLVGVDPTGIKFSEYYPPEIMLISDFFSSKCIKEKFGDQKAKVITSFSMFYDLEEPLLFARDIAKILDNSGVWILEQSYLPTMLTANSFDTICHEHLEFYSLAQIDWIVRRVGLKIRDVELNSINGGSFSVEVVQQASTAKINDEKIQGILSDELKLGLNKNGNAFNKFFEDVNTEREKFLDFLQKAKNKNETVFGLGASTKGNVLLQYYGIDASLITAIGEINSDKIGSYTPGTLIPLISEEEMLSLNPDYIVVLPWHFKKHFIAQKKLQGRKLVFPLPNLEIVQL